MPLKAKVLTMSVDVIQLSEVINKTASWLADDSGKYICVSNVHMCIETYISSEFAAVVNQADLVVPDGRPIYWAQRLLGFSEGEQIRGMDLTLELCQYAAEQGLKVGFYGGSLTAVSAMKRRLLNQYPGLNIVIAESPPFRPLSEMEKKQAIEAINSSEVDILFVGLGCPKQEKWMAEHKDKFSCVMLGVGAVFDFLAGSKKHAPIWMQQAGLEWFYRLLDEPRRLWRRYLYTNPKFVFLFIRQLLGKKF